MDSFIEYMIEQKHTPIIRLKKVLIYFAAFFVSIIVMLLMLPFPAAITFLPAVMAGLFFGAYFWASSFNVEFEYILTNGELDIDMITHKKRRKRLLTIHSKAFIEFGKQVESSNTSSDKKDFSKIIDASSKSKTYDNYYAVFFKNGQKVKLIFNPTQKMLDIFKIYAPRAIKGEL